ncbi:hypothetical protein HDU83_000579 [Entophlyctis luteolus]|nr:hypothetical protein HDU83_000579 [Entophlyctis luteolus]
MNKTVHSVTGDTQRRKSSAAKLTAKEINQRILRTAPGLDPATKHNLEGSLPRLPTKSDVGKVLLGSLQSVDSRSGHVGSNQLLPYNQRASRSDNQEQCWESTQHSTEDKLPLKTESQKSVEIVETNDKCLGGLQQNDNRTVETSNKNNQEASTETAYRDNDTVVDHGQELQDLQTQNNKNMDEHKIAVMHSGAIHAQTNSYVHDSEKCYSYLCSTSPSPLACYSYAHSHTARIGNSKCTKCEKLEDECKNLRQREESLLAERDSLINFSQKRISKLESVLDQTILFHRETMYSLEENVKTMKAAKIKEYQDLLSKYEKLQREIAQSKTCRYCESRREEDATTTDRFSSGQNSSSKYTENRASNRSITSFVDAESCEDNSETPKVKYSSEAPLDSSIIPLSEFQELIEINEKLFAEKARVVDEIEALREENDRQLKELQKLELECDKLRQIVANTGNARQQHLHVLRAEGPEGDADVLVVHELKLSEESLRDSRDRDPGTDRDSDGECDFE